MLNDRLAVAGDLVSEGLFHVGKTDVKLEIIHEYIEERGTDRINWIVIWLIVVACLVELVS